MPPLTTLSRSAGVLLHPTSLPGPFGVGDLGPSAHAWVQRLGAAGIGWWQVLPLGPTGYGDSPYQSPSSFAGNPNLISPELLVDDGLLDRKNLADFELPEGPVPFEEVISARRALVKRACDNFRHDTTGLHDDFAAFGAREAEWLDDFALFMAIKDAHDGVAWWDWPEPLAFRRPSALIEARTKLRDEIDRHRFAQFLFFRQWADLRDAARQNGIGLIGDLPIFVARDSVDVWTLPELFQLDERRRPLFVAGVPPDYFAATGQLWGNPLYAWEALRATNYAWWIARMRAALRLVDRVRLDHFRGVEAYWAVPAGDDTAKNGAWQAGPRDDLLVALRDALRGLPIFAEDLGFITPEVDALRERFGLPGIRLLQFAFGGAVEERFLPHRFTRNLVAYTGTHDNDTTLGWYEHLTADQRRQFYRYAPEASNDPVRALLRLTWASVADFAIVPLQDVLGLGSEARMNRPGIASGNWRWRATAEHVAEGRLAWLAEMTAVYDRQLPVRDASQKPA
ncbi:MAG: 4-alpha-glucanotransferase [Gemmataceae bacterium]